MKRLLSIMFAVTALIITTNADVSLSFQKQELNPLQTSLKIKQTQVIQVASSSYPDKIKMTYYSYHDNQAGDSGTYGSYAIAYSSKHFPASIHKDANDKRGGDGSYTNPIIIATPLRFNEEWPVGTRMYAPHLKKYLIVEDECDTDVCRQNKLVDLWMYSKPGNDTNKVSQCQRNWTYTGYDKPWDVIVNPPNNKPVDNKPFFYTKGQGNCRKVPFKS